MRICVADGEREQHKQLMDNLERRLHANHIVFWLRENYMVGTSGSLSKRSVYNHYLNVTKQVTKKPLISPTFFGKLVKRAFPSIKCNRKGPRGHTKQHYTHLQRISMNQEEERAFPTGDEIGLLPDSPSDGSDVGGFMDSPCSPESASKIFLSTGSTGSLSFGENEEMTYLSCLMPGSNGSATMMNPQQHQHQQQPAMVCTAPASPGGTSSRSTSPTSWMFLSNPAQHSDMLADQQPGMELPVSSSSMAAVSSPSSGCLYCVECQQASKAGVAQPALHVTNMPAVDDAAYIKQEPLTWLPEEMTSPASSAESSSVYMAQASSCGTYSAYPSSGLEQLPLYVTMPAGLTNPSSPPSVEIALPLEDDWTAFLMDN
ncbi:RFX DNAbinding domain containing protein [Acanthamoeba castellanii str. Neff]|uniref:RFX DNAbinding domain containing protein n=1 Tax=Acanthamoeba castellanii (strain ATCC 30010 / Neff) TaxID=1257118 RepID=L8HL10_ACACF|nr:RFX DNAbinding domain containing protein [Acanthamoeba castellanii str. Neff]ELR25061.1 RFX DNAbinding domain containing protein [Acanthamoeba castellanii str. Neff]